MNKVGVHIVKNLLKNLYLTLPKCDQSHLSQLFGFSVEKTF